MTDATLSDAELAACPFCGSLAGLEAHGAVFREGDGVGYRVECAGKCHAMTCYWHTRGEAVSHWNTRLRAPSTPIEAGVVEADLSALMHRWIMQEIGRLMQQAEHWARENKPRAVHHRVTMADNYFQIAVLFDPARQANGYPPAFDQIRAALAQPEIKPPGAYPPSKELHAYRDPIFTAARLTALTAGAVPDGFVLMPVNGTPEMRAAYKLAHAHAAGLYAPFEDVYAVLINIAARPSPDAGAGG